MIELSEKLKGAGLKGKESVVYLSLIKNGPIGGGDLARLLNMDRTHTYNLLRNLINKGLASHIIKNKKTLFQTTPSKNLLNKIQKQERIIKSIIPKLESLEKSKPQISTVKILEGKAGIRTMARILLESKTKEILVYGGTGRSFKILEYEMPHIAKKTSLLKMKGRIITSKKLKGELFTKLPNFKMRYIKELTSTSIMIFGDYISINILEDKPTVILIESKSVSRSHRKYFDYLWKQAKK